VREERLLADGNPATLRAIKVAHTIVWAIMAGCILTIPWVSWRGEYRTAGWLATVVLVEVAVLALNRWRCPLTSVAARHTVDRRDNFDIYLPEWLAKHNKLIFGSIYILGAAFALARWARTQS
jgi:hypothetical protein